MPEDDPDELEDDPDESEDDDPDEPEEESDEPEDEPDEASRFSFCLASFLSAPDLADESSSRLRLAVP